MGVLTTLFQCAQSPFLKGRQIFRCLSLNISTRVDCSGILSPVATPFNNDESINFDKLAENLDEWNKTDLKGYLVQGSNGETVSLSTEERLLLIKQARTFIPRNKILLAGAGCEGTMNTIKMCEEMAAAGADAVMLVSPSFYKSGLNDRSLIHHYSAVADRCPLPVFLYSVPAYTGVDLSVAAIRTLSQHPNICGIKDSGGDVTKLAALVHVTAGNNFQVLAGSAGYLLAALHVGCVGAICGLANVLPRELCQLFDLFVATTSGTAHAAASEALSLQRRLIEPNSAVTKTLGVPAMKFAMDIMGYYGGPTRSPLLPLLADQQEAVKTLFNEFL
ncbi:4-hydroxy-2-oxoglutarate aldolase, mitochondrial [Hyalella azteca]|uniref:4-hydroxy-2-oxoglutarate aldolase, mitochondrial n=1 Tax=Hyalella azteca TaxID=294128 RepID=A0A8B7NPS5_HYAAZ|nr:4-hydroxy-2-oxoglutarate aldolase, mitochondrial [Hyalella azteca]